MVYCTNCGKPVDKCNCKMNQPEKDKMVKPAKDSGKKVITK